MPDFALLKTLYTPELVKLKDQLTKHLDTSRMQCLVGDITHLPKWAMPNQGIVTEGVKVVYARYSSVPQQVVYDLILLIKPDALCGKMYPNNLYTFEERHPMQPNDLSYIMPDDVAIGTVVQEIACDILGCSTHAVG